jgi:3-(3-hydroxy-phenyl)propionate hydroxylase
MASEFARHGVACRIIDKSPTQSQASKALVIQSRTLELFDLMDIVAEFLALGTKIYAVNMYTNGEQLVRLTFDELNGPYPFMLDLAQSETERILKHLKRFGLHVERQVELVKFVQTSDSVNSTLLHHSSSNDGDDNDNNNQEELVRSSWLIGCDGAHSTVRHILDIPFSGATYPEYFALADIKLQWPLADNETHIFLHKDGILAAFPLSNAVEERGGKRYQVSAEATINQSNPSREQNKEESDGEERQQKKKQQFSINNYEPTRDFRRFIKDRVVPINNKAGEGAAAEIILTDLTWSSMFKIHRRRAEQYKQGRVFLAGDAAHIHSPASGQGMNTGIQDAYNLAWKLALVIKSHAYTSILYSYEAERQPVTESVLNMTDFLFRMGTSHDPVSQQLRNHLFPLVAHPMVNQISELAINYRKSPIVSEYISNPSLIYDRLRATKSSTPKAGDRAPEGYLRF